MHSRESLITPEEILLLSQNSRYQPCISESVEYIFQELHRLNILTPAFRKKIIDSTILDCCNSFDSMERGFKILRAKRHLTAANAAAFLQYHVYAEYHMVGNLIELDRLAISTEKHRQLACQINDPNHRIPNILYFLAQKNLLTNETYIHMEHNLDIIVNSGVHHFNFEQLKKHISAHDSPSIPDILQTLRLEMITVFLNRASLNTDENRAKLLEKMRFGKEIYYFSLLLNSRKLLNQKNFDLLLNHASNLHQYIRIDYSAHPVLMNLDSPSDDVRYIDEDIFKKILSKDIKNSAIECAQIQHASRQKAHFFYRAPDDVLKHLYSFTSPAHAEQKKHFVTNIFKLPDSWQTLPSRLKK